MPILAQTLFRNVSLEIHEVLDRLAAVEQVISRHLIEQGQDSAILDLQHLDYIRQSLSTLHDFFDQLPLHVSDSTTFATLPSLLKSAEHLKDHLITESNSAPASQTKKGDIDLF